VNISIIVILLNFLLSKSVIPQFGGEYLILKTDYLNYGIEYSCTDLDEGGSIGE